MQFRIRPVNLRTDSGAKARLFRRAPLQGEFALIDPSFVAEAVEEVPAQSGRRQPVVAAARHESLAIRFQGTVQSHLWAKSAAVVVGLGLRQACRELRLARFRRLRHRAVLPLL